jgi:hypothetical protein
MLDAMREVDESSRDLDEAHQDDRAEVTAAENGAEFSPTKESQ